MGELANQKWYYREGILITCPTLHDRPRIRRKKHEYRVMEEE
jgi:hypothetical protein